MGTYALMEGNVVANIILYDGDAEYLLDVIPVSDEVGIGWTRGQDTFTAPAVEVPPLPDDPTETLRVSAMHKLMAGTHLTQDEACAITGVPNPGNNGNGEPNGKGRVG